MHFSPILKPSIRTDVTQELPADPGNSSPRSVQQEDTGNATSSDRFDEYGAELGPEARVWKVYVKESRKFDTNRFEDWNRWLDVTLLFAALFTAICTAFVIESSKWLSEDPAEESTQQLALIYQALTPSTGQSTNPNGGQENSTRINFSLKPTTLCVNIFWFYSLTLSATVSFISILAKEWCRRPPPEHAGESWEAARNRQLRWEMLQRWRVEEVVNFLPSLMHLAVASFSIGLCIYLWDTHFGVAVPVISIVTAAAVAYISSTILPLWDETCPYGTPLTKSIKDVFYYRIPPFDHHLGFPPTKSSNNNPDASIVARALAWLIKRSEDPESVDTALQAIAGAVPNDQDRQLLRDSGADRMISTRLMSLNPHAKDYERLLDLYSRAQSFFQPSPIIIPTTSVQQDVVPIRVRGEAIHGSCEAVRVYPGGVQKASSRELQRKICVLRDTINKQITASTTSSDPKRFILSTPGNLQALRIGSTAASHCLRSLQHGIHVQAEEQFNSATELWESYKNSQTHIDHTAIPYLMAGVAMLLSSLLIDCPPDVGAQYVMRFFRAAASTERRQNEPRSEYLGLPMVAYALSRHDYPGWTKTPPLSPISRAERAIEVITHYVSQPSNLSGISPIMINLALMELLSDPEGYKLDDSDIAVIGEAYNPTVDDAGSVPIHTFATNPDLDTPSRTIQGIATVLSNKQAAGADSAIITCLGVLNCMPMDDAIGPVPLAIGQLYAFVTDYLLDPPLSDPESYGQNIALDLMLKLSYLRWTAKAIDGLAQSLGIREIPAKLKEATELKTTGDDVNFIIKLFATGQAWFLINLAIESETVEQPAWRCLRPLVGNKEVWNSLDFARVGYEKERTILAWGYRRMFESDTTRRHEYFRMIYDSLPAEASLPVIAA